MIKYFKQHSKEKYKKHGSFPIDDRRRSRPIRKDICSIFSHCLRLCPPIERIWIKLRIYLTKDTHICSPIDYIAHRLEMSGLVCQKQISRAWISKYTNQYVWDAITYPCTRYLLLAYILAKETCSYILWILGKYEHRHILYADLQTSYGCPISCSHRLALEKKNDLILFEIQ